MSGWMKAGSPRLPYYVRRYSPLVTGEVRGSDGGPWDWQICVADEFGGMVLHGSGPSTYTPEAAQSACDAAFMRLAEAVDAAKKEIG